MARAAVLASGSGTNFEAIARALAAGGRHSVCRLVCDRAGAFALERARALGISSSLVPYKGRPRQEAEAQIAAILEEDAPDLVVLAGFMRILGSAFVRRWKGRLVNIHPALLPRHPGAHGIDDSWASGDRLLGITIHWVDEGMDTGPVIVQKSFDRSMAADRDAAEAMIHALEHEWYPRVIGEILDGAINA